jgi:integrase/recombinase XerD
VKSDREIIQMWLHGKAKRTVKDYQRDVEQFISFVQKPLPEIELSDLQAFATDLNQRNLKPASITRKINAIKSLFTFAAEQAHIAFNVAAALKPPKIAPNLAGRILTKEDVHKLINAGKTERERLFMLLSYAIATRISETCSIKWEDFIIQSNGNVQVTINGKGGKVAPVLVPKSVWEELQVLRGESDRVFPMSRRTAHDIVKRAARSANLNPRISAHWLRHSHARTAIEAGAPLHIIRDTLRHSNISVSNWYLESFPEESSSKDLDL